jgi:hypothetical protein
VAEYSNETQSSTTSRNSRGGIGCCGCCGLTLGLLLLSAVLLAAQLLTWTRAFWSTADSSQRAGAVLVAILVAAAAATAAWRARPRVTARTRVVTTRVMRRTPGDVSEDRAPTGELLADWKPAVRPDADGADGPLQDSGPSE